MASSPVKVAIVTGANKGIGYAICRQIVLQYNQQTPLRLLFTSRDETRGKEALSSLVEELDGKKLLGPQDGKPVLEYHQLDISDPQSIDNLAAYVTKTYGGVDYLMNNSGVASKGDAFDEKIVEDTLKTNYYGTLDICQKFLPILKPEGRIVNVSSTAGNLSKCSPEIQGQVKSADISKLTALMKQFQADVKDGSYAAKGWPKTAYGISKVGVTALTRILAKSDDPAKHHLIVSCCPGYVATDMSSHKGHLTPDQGAQTPVWLLFEDSETLENGQIYRDKKSLASQVGF